MGFAAKIESVVTRIRPIGLKLLTFVEVKMSRDGSPSITGDQVGPPGDDSPPLDTDSALGIELDQSGRVAAAAFYDPKNPSKAEPGEKRFYSRDPKTGLIVAEVFMKGDGSVEISNLLGSFKLDKTGALDAEVTTFSVANELGSLKLGVDGTWTINDLVTIDVAGNVAGTDFLAGVISLLNHLHAAGALLDSVPLPVTGVSAVPQ